MTLASFKVQRSQSEAERGKDRNIRINESVVQQRKKHFSGEEAEKQQSPHKRPLASFQKQKKLEWTLCNFLIRTPLNCRQLA